jgi:hypothetical protein
MVEGAFARLHCLTGEGSKGTHGILAPIVGGMVQKMAWVTPILAGPSAAGEDDMALGDDMLKAAVTKKKVVSEQVFQMRATGTYFKIY